MFSFFRRKRNIKASSESLAVADAVKSGEQEHVQLRDEQNMPPGECAWIEPDENKWHLRLLDCSSVVSNLMAFTEKQDIAMWYSSRTPDYANEYPMRREKDGRDIPLHFVYPMTDPAKEGVVHWSRDMEDKWDIFFYDKTILMCRSWTGELVFRFVPDFEDQKMILNDVSVQGMEDYDEEFLRRMVDYLVKRLMYKWIVPAPLPPAKDTNKKEMALLAFTLYGNDAVIVTTEDTTRCRHGGLIDPHTGEPIHEEGS